MKVLHFIWSAQFGGIEKLVITLAQQQQQNPQLQVALLVGTRKGNFLTLIEKAGLRCEFADLTSGFDFSLARFKRIKNLMSAYDLIHLHTFNPVVAWAAVKSGKKIVFTVHGNFGFGRHRRITDRMLQLMCGYFIRNHVSHITYNSEFSRQYAITFYQLKNHSNGTLIYNAVPGDAPTLTDEVADLLPIRSHHFVIGTASRFAGFKRIDRLIEAYSIFCRDKHDTRLLLAGDGIKMQELKALVKNKHLENQVIFTGYRENIFAWLNKMDVCVFPSENEPFGIVAVEALSLGKPVLVFADGGGLTEIIKPLNRLNIAEHTTQLVERLNYYYYNRNAITDEQETNRQYALRFDMASNEQAFFRVYSHVLNKDAK
jgi:glycosyltransferase involved in cell wall biosynthesis